MTLCVECGRTTGAHLLGCSRWETPLASEDAPPRKAAPRIVAAEPEDPRAVVDRWHANGTIHIDALRGIARAMRAEEINDLDCETVELAADVIEALESLLEDAEGRLEDAEMTIQADQREIRDLVAELSERS